MPGIDLPWGGQYARLDLTPSSSITELKLSRSSVDIAGSYLLAVACMHTFIVVVDCQVLLGSPLRKAEGAFALERGP